MSSMAGDSRADVLLASEIESYVTSLQTSSVMELGSLGWIEKHERIKQLTVQAVIQALSDKEETVKECLITHDKLPVVVHEVILVELWREKILAELMKDSETPTCNFTIYSIMYHEATCINLLETVLFHPDSMEVLDDAILDLTDYCLRSLSGLISKPYCDKEGKGAGDAGTHQQQEDLRFGIAIKCLTCIRFVIENLAKVPSAVIPRLIITSDTPMLLTEILNTEPWIKVKNSGNVLEYNSAEQSWKEIDPSEKLMVGNVEAQAWLSLYQLFLNAEIVSSYEITDFRKNQLIKLRGKLNEVFLDQIPVLTAFQRWLNEIAISNCQSAPSKSPLLIEMLAPIRTALESEFQKNYTKIIALHKQELISPSQRTLAEKASRLASVYNFESFESALPPSKCANCGEEGNKRCSRCLNEWYCSSLLISEKTTAGELVDILFRYNTHPSNQQNYTLHLEMNDYFRQLEYNERVLAEQLHPLLKPLQATHPQLSHSTLYDNVTKPHKWRRKSCSDYELSEAFFV